MEQRAGRDVQEREELTDVYLDLKAEVGKGGVEQGASRDIQEVEEFTDAYLDLTAEVGKGRSSLMPTWTLQQR